ATSPNLPPCPAKLLVRGKSILPGDAGKVPRNKQGMFELLDHGVRLAFIDERPATGDRGEPILLIHGFASTHAVNWVFPQWVKTLTETGRRVVAFDNRGHGRSEKFHDPAAYAMQKMAGDSRALPDHLHIETARS